MNGITEQNDTESTRNKDYEKLIMLINIRIMRQNPILSVPETEVSDAACCDDVIVVTNTASKLVTVIVASASLMPKSCKFIFIAWLKSVVSDWIEEAVFAAAAA